MSSPLITTSELAARLRDPSLVIVDMRHDLAQPEHWGEAQYNASHIPGARFAHLDRDLSARKTGTNGRHPLLSPEAAAAVLSRLDIDATKHVVVYDQQGGQYAARLWWMLRWLGHDAVAVLDGGFDRWVREGRPVTTDVPPPGEASFAVRHGVATSDANEIQAAGADLTLIDARAPERYRGENEPLDPVAGRIPGALNRYWSTNVNPDGTFKTPEAIRSEFAALLGDTPLDRVVHYCGSGVTACHNLLAMEVAGLPGTRLYPGSWSEWCADASHPVERG